MTTYYIHMYSHSYQIVNLNKNKLQGLSLEGKIMQRVFAQSVLILYLSLLPGINVSDFQNYLLNIEILFLKMKL